ncbi:methyltransferase [Pelagibius sp. Alg239-R121]|uniref:class I SAM-dependent methyltransferase n=1 Tax=Pelagibius sp. Alg239-R121 TaxID=2993448 RepID=UPI0024A79B10|nr:methyltransferase [Pelagibius sp. Alg239-R121]
MLPDLTKETQFVRANTALLTAPLIPEIRLFLASEISPIWQATEEELAAKNLPPPFWAFAWAGGQALARYLLDHPAKVSGKRVLDFASGSGLQAIAAMQSGASRVEAVDIDRFAVAALCLNAKENGVKIDVALEDYIGRENAGWDLVLAGDVCYEEPMASRTITWLRMLAASGATVLLGDPSRSYLPKSGLERVISYAVKTTRELEDTDVRNAIVWQVSAEA